MREVHVVAGIDGGSSFLDFVVEPWNLVYGCIVADHHSVEPHIVTQNVLEYFGIGNAVGAVDCMVAGHERLAPGQTDHGLMRKQDFLHQLFLIGIATASIAKIML